MPIERETGPIISNEEMVAGIKARYHNQPWTSTALVAAFSINEQQAAAVIESWIDKGLISGKTTAEGESNHYKFKEQSETNNKEKLTESPDREKSFSKTAVKETLNQIAAILEHTAPALRSKKTFSIDELRERTGKGESLIRAALATISDFKFSQSGTLDVEPEARLSLIRAIRSLPAKKRIREFKFTNEEKGVFFAFFLNHAGTHFNLKHLCDNKIIPGQKNKIKLVADTLVKEGLIKSIIQKPKPPLLLKSQKVYFFENENSN